MSVAEIDWVQDAAETRGLDVRGMRVELGRRRMVGGQADMTVDVALDLKARAAPA